MIKNPTKIEQMPDDLKKKLEEVGDWIIKNIAPDAIAGDSVYYYRKDDLIILFKVKQMVGPGQTGTYWLSGF